MKDSNDIFCDSTVEFSCDACYELMGNSQLTCLPNQTWSGKEPNCNGQWLVVYLHVELFHNISCTLLCSSSAAYVDLNNEDTSTIDPKDIIKTIGPSDAFFLVQNVTLLSVVGFGPEVVSGLLEYVFGGFFYVVWFFLFPIQGLDFCGDKTPYPSWC